ncbi:MAG: nucleotidyltransferase [Ruminococcaceae bacterium]|nr:nucleotidyltransferase [Oscillospiraceae bacterium]
MKILAVICEYNPFHNGHAYQLRKQKEELDCDGVVCLMSGSFVQRGEPAMFDKWSRCEMALNSGCDLVLELPVLYSLQSAEGFARGGVSLLSKLGLEGYLGFGSESGNIDALISASEIMDSSDFHVAVKESLSTGISYPKACADVLSKLSGGSFDLNESPNDILGIEYIKSLKTEASQLKPSIIKRTGSSHDSLTPVDGYMSASGIRNAIQDGRDVSSFMPKEAYSIVMREIRAGKGPVLPEDISSLLCYAVTSHDREWLADISGVSEGIEKRIADSVAANRSFEGIVSGAKTKRYPQTRIQRILMNMLLSIRKEDEKLSQSYARVLGLNAKGAEILRQMQKLSDIPIVTKTADASFSDEGSNRLFQLDVLATDIYSLLYPKKSAGRNGMDFYRSPIILYS